MFIEPKLCENCGHNINPTAKFCAGCGTPVPEKPQPTCSACGTEVEVEGRQCDKCLEVASTRTSTSIPEQAAEQEIVPGKVPEELEEGFRLEEENIDADLVTRVKPLSARRNSRRALLAITTLVVLGLSLAVFSASQVPESKNVVETSSKTPDARNTPSGSKEPELPFLAIDKVFSREELEEVAFGICSPLEQKVLSKLSLKTYQSHMSDLGAVEDAYEARDLVSANSWAKELFLADYETGINSLLSKTLIDSSTWDESKFQIDPDSWAGGFINLALDSCNLDLLYEDTHQAIRDLQAEADRVLSLAASAPWYPKGFEEVPVDNSFAYGLDVDKECSSLAESCAVFKIVSQKTCSEVTIIVDFFDKNDREVDSTIGYLKSVSANEPKLANFSSLEKAETFAITSLSCG